MKLGILFFPFMLAAQTATYPGSVVTDTQLKVLKDRAQTTLTSALNASATSISVTSSSKFGANVVITIDSEQISVCAVGSGTMTVGHSSCPNIDGRGFNGTAAASHTNSSVVSAYLVAWNDNAQSAEIKAVENALGANLANIIALIPNPTPVANGGTNAATAAGARTNLGAAASGANSDITSLSNISTPLTVAEGGTNAGTAAGARSSLGAAASGANSDITSLSNISTPLTVAEGGTNAATAAGARTSLGAAASGANADITSLASLSTPIPTAGGGTGVASPTAHTVAVAEGSSAMAFVAPSTAGRILTSNGASADPSFQDPIAVFPAGSQTQYLRLKPNSGNSTTAEFAFLTSLNAADYNYTAQQPGGSIAIGSNSIAMSPCPLGFSKATSGTQVLTALYISGGAGTAEVVAPTGTSTCTSGAASGTVTFVAANTHTGAWTVASPSFGLQEAVNVAQAAGGATIRLGAGSYTLYATVTITTSNVKIEGSGIAPTPPTSGYGTYISRTGDFGDSIYVNGAAGTLFNVSISGLRIEQVINYVAGSPPTLSNKPTSGAHVHVLNCVDCYVKDNDLRWMPYGVEVDTVGWTHVDGNTVLGLWDYLNANAQIGIAGIYIHHSQSGGGLPTYLWVEHNTVLGPGSVSRTFSVNGNNITQVEPVGAKNGILVESCELCWIRENSIEWQGGSGIGIIAPAVHAVADSLLVIEISGNYIDKNRTNGILLDMTANTLNFALGTKINNNWLLGSESTINLIKIAGSPSPPAFIRAAHETSITANVLRFSLGSAIFMLAGEHTIISGNVIASYNELNSYPTNSTADRQGNSGIYIDQAAGAITATSNKLGGNYLGNSVAGGGVYTYNGIAVGTLTQQAASTSALVLAPNGDGGVQAPSSRSPAVAFDPAFFMPAGPLRMDGLPSVAVSVCGSLNANSTVQSGFITSGTTGACAPVLTFTNITASNGWACHIDNRTTANLIRQTASSTTTATFSGTTVNGDVLSYSCTAY